MGLVVNGVWVELLRLLEFFSLLKSEAYSPCSDSCSTLECNLDILRLMNLQIVLYSDSVILTTPLLGHITVRPLKTSTVCKARATRLFSGRT